MLGLKTIKANRTSYNGFLWPGVGGTATAPDWDGKPRCAGGLHFLPWGGGNGNLLNWSSSALWLVVDDGDSPDTVLFEGKAKARSLTVAFEGTRRQATDFLVARAPSGKAVAGATVTAGNWGTAMAGNWGTAMAGNWGTATAGDWGTAMAGDRGTAMAGDWGTATAGAGGVIIMAWWDRVAKRRRLATGYIGEGGLKSGVPYKADGEGRFIEA